MMLALPEGVIPLAVGTVLALGGLTLVLSPLMSDNATDTETAEADSAKPRTRVSAARHDLRDIPADSAVVALREIEFDKETGKLSDNDYVELKRRYTQMALEEMRAASVEDSKVEGAVIATSVAANNAALDPVEAAIQRARESQRACEICGPRPEPDAVYCSSCGRYLAGSCGECGTPVDLVGSHYCTNCGENLAAV